MSPRLHLGRTVEGEDFTLPLELVTQTAAVVGIRGSGKTVTGTVEVEEALRAGVPVVVIDPTDVWWGLKSSADGESPGHPVVIFGGSHGDLPLDAGAGRAIADLVVEQRIPVVLSLRHLRKGQQRTFVMDFAEQLYHRKGEPEHRTPLLIAIDEASTFVPQRVAGDTARLVGAIQDLVRLGRSSGFGVILIDQRPASVNKDVLTQLEVLVAHRITSPQDRKALLEWVQQHDTEGHRATFLEQLASLPQGHAWFWSPALDVFELVHVRMRSTFDSSRTPRLGEVLAAPKAWAEVDLEAVRDQVASAVEEAAANDPKELRRRIATLERELERNQPESLPDEAALKAILDEATHRLEQRITAAVSALEVAEGFRTEMEAAYGEYVRLTRHAAEILSGAGAGDRPLDLASAHASAARTWETLGAYSREEVSDAPRPQPENGPEIHPPSRPQQRILDTLASFHALGLEAVDRSNVAVFSDQSPTSSGFANNLGRLRTMGLVDYPGSGLVALTPTGRGWAGDPSPIRSVRELHSCWMEKLSNPQAAILFQVLENHPHPIARQELAERSNQSPTSSGYANNLGKLRSLGLIDYPRAGEVAATDLLFPKGLR